MRRYLISLSSTTDRSLWWQKWRHCSDVDEAVMFAKLALVMARGDVPGYAAMDTWTVTEPGGAKMLPRIVASGHAEAE